MRNGLSLPGMCLSNCLNAGFQQDSGFTSLALTLLPGSRESVLMPGNSELKLAKPQPWACSTKAVPDHHPQAKSKEAGRSIDRLRIPSSPESQRQSIPALEWPPQPQPGNALATTNLQCGGA